MSKLDPSSSTTPAEDSRAVEEEASVAADVSRGGRADGDFADPHPFWLKEWRSLRAGLAGGGPSAEDMSATIRRLRDDIAKTPAKTLAGLQAQAELISELAWNEVVATTARQLLAGIKQLNERSGE